MPVVGLGIDIVNIKRIEKVLSNSKSKFLLKILHKKEKNKVKLTVSSVAKKFAAKEAFAKALGTGIGKTINFNEIHIDHSKGW